MSVRDNLLRLHRWRLQERQDYLAGLESLMERLRADARRLQDEIAETERAAGRPANHLAGNDAGGSALYLGPMLDRREKIERSLAEIEVQIEEARETVAAAQQEVKHAENGAGGIHATPAPMRVTRRTRRDRQPAPRAPVPFAGNTRLF
ncbi:MAG TPA: hypothetical protein VHW66_10885 [Stellaceae bacterium]|jgi:predicted  nucleic acid-binding Zn-ribbon protein|nr:hypothetical protein [Stellaceae bacterium]